MHTHIYIYTYKYIYVNIYTNPFSHARLGALPT